MLNNLLYTVVSLILTHNVNLQLLLYMMIYRQIKNKLPYTHTCIKLYIKYRGFRRDYNNKR